MFSSSAVPLRVNVTGWLSARCMFGGSMLDATSDSALPDFMVP